MRYLMCNTETIRRIFDGLSCQFVVLLKVNCSFFSLSFADFRIN